MAQQAVEVVRFRTVGSRGFCADRMKSLKYLENAPARPDRSGGCT
jgi:hypothetical protein